MTSSSEWSDVDRLHPEQLACNNFLSALVLAFLPLPINVLLLPPLVTDVLLLQVSPVLLFLLVLLLMKNAVSGLNWNKCVEGDGTPSGQNTAGGCVANRELVHTIVVQVPESLKVGIPSRYNNVCTLGFAFAEQASQEFVKFVEHGEKTRWIAPDGAGGRILEEPRDAIRVSYEGSV